MCVSLFRYLFWDPQLQWASKVIIEFSLVNISMQLHSAGTSDLHLALICVFIPLCLWLNFSYPINWINTEVTFLCVLGRIPPCQAVARFRSKRTGFWEVITVLLVSDGARIQLSHIQTFSACWWSFRMHTCLNHAWRFAKLCIFTFFCRSFSTCQNMHTVHLWTRRH